MLQSLKLSHLMIRIGLAAIFFWFGIDKFIHPDYWMTAWLPAAIGRAVENLGISELYFVYLVGIVEVLIGTSLVSTLLMRVFAVVGIALFLLVLPFGGFTMIAVRDVGLIFVLISIIVWPERRFV